MGADGRRGEREKKKWRPSNFLASRAPPLPLGLAFCASLQISCDPLHATVSTPTKRWLCEQTGAPLARATVSGSHSLLKTFAFSSFSSQWDNEGPVRRKCRQATWLKQRHKSNEMATSDCCLVEIPTTTQELSEIVTYRALKFRSRTWMTPLTGPFNKLFLHQQFLPVFHNWVSWFTCRQASFSRPQELFW